MSGRPCFCMSLIFKHNLEMHMTTIKMFSLSLFDVIMGFIEYEFLLIFIYCCVHLVILDCISEWMSYCIEYLYSLSSLLQNGAGHG